MERSPFVELTIEEVIAKVRKLKPEVKKIHSVTQYPHRSDYYLWMVLVSTDTQTISWVYNSQVNGLSDGHYCNNEDNQQGKYKAYNVLTHRLSTKVPASVR